MAKLKNGIYTEPQNLTPAAHKRKLRAKGLLRTENARRLKQSDDEQRDAQRDLYKLRNA